MRLIYRIRQFWHALSASPTQEQLELAQTVLTPQLLGLFLKLQASEQAHSLRIFEQLVEGGETHTDLLVAALLHDVGKSRYPLRLPERVIIVLGKKFFPGQVRLWAKAKPSGWRRPFVVAEQHATWGAEMAAQAGASALATAIIQRHQDHFDDHPVALEERLINRLQALDDEN